MKRDINSKVPGLTKLDLNIEVDNHISREYLKRLGVSEGQLKKVKKNSHKNKINDSSFDIGTDNETSIVASFSKTSSNIPNNSYNSMNVMSDTSDMDN